MEVECLGACVNAPMLQIGKDFYEDLDGPITEKLIADLRAGEPSSPARRTAAIRSEPQGGATTLTDPALYDGSMIGKHQAQRAPAKADAEACAQPQKPPGAAT